MKKTQKESLLRSSSGQQLAGNTPEAPSTLPRRGFLKTIGLLGGSTILGQSALASESNTQITSGEIPFKSLQEEYKFQSPLDLSPAKWLWYPGDRTLPNTFALPDLALTVHTPHGPFGFSGKGPIGTRKITLTLPPDAAGELVVHPDEMLKLKSLGKGRFSLPAGKTVELRLKYI